MLYLHSRHYYQSHDFKNVGLKNPNQPQEYTDTFKQNLTCIFQSVRGVLKETFQCETPCITYKAFYLFKWSTWIKFERHD